MKCFVCKHELTEKDFCTYCKADVSLYKRIIRLSNGFYNEGLQKAKVRDLSGAAVALRECLKCNKENIEARNLLGLVYFEMGEVVSALSEWVYSQNYSREKNLANDYLDIIAQNPNPFKELTNAITKYNQALIYCRQNSMDLAKIQLQKVVKMNPNFLKARLLLSLVMIAADEWDKALTQVRRCLLVDTANTHALYYLSEIREHLGATELPRDMPKTTRSRTEKVATDAQIYDHGHDMIIQPPPVKDMSLLRSVLFMIFGIALGLAVSFILIQPARIESAQTEQNDEIRKLGDQISAQNAAQLDLTQRNADLTDRYEALKEEMNSLVGDNADQLSIDSLLGAVSTYLEDNSDIPNIISDLELIEEDYIAERATPEFKRLYNALGSIIGEKASLAYYTTGYQAYKDADYDRAIKDLTYAVKYDPQNGEALLNLANTYYDSGNRIKASELYAQVAEEYPNTERGRKATQRLDEILQND